LDEKLFHSHNVTVLKNTMTKSAHHRDVDQLIASGAADKERERAADKSK